ncbi:divergent polysaccharide deacetylase family protein [Iodidimonas sp. SYSU 1G8]|uniref:divergent polysaccharide deacetylase family protein n=1 Tax=Iodidimonas sp. SYSU 1G8 TaxID=3133967 RepID=UPI0031FF14B1
MSSRNRKSRSSRFSLNRSNLPLIVAAAMTAASVVVVIVVMLGSDEPEPAPKQSSDIAGPAEPVPAETLPPEKQAGADPIGDLIASLPDQSGARPETSTGTAPADPSSVDGEPAWKRYATAVTVPEGQPRIAVVIDDVGLNRARTNDAISLPATVTLAFLPYGDDLQKLADKARTMGHEVMLHLPMQPDSDKDDPGPQALLTSLPPGALGERIAANMDSFTGYVGFNNHMGSKFTADQAGMGAVMEAARSRGLMFLDSRTTPHSKGGAAAARFGVPALSRDIFIDNVATEAAVRKQLDKAAAMAREKGHAIIIGHPHEATIAALRAWIPTLKDVSLVPITALLDATGGVPALATTPEAD